MRISDWSSDVCSSDLPHRPHLIAEVEIGQQHALRRNAAHGRVPGELERGGRKARGDRHREHGGNRRGSAEHARSQAVQQQARSEEHTSELQSLMRSSYAVFCLKKKKKKDEKTN